MNSFSVVTDENEQKEVKKAPHQFLSLVFLCLFRSGAGYFFRPAILQLKPCSCFSSANRRIPILGDPGADSGGEGMSKQAEKYCTKEK